MSNFLDSTVPADGLASSGAATLAGKVITKFRPCIYIQNCHLKGWETRTTRTPAFSGYSPPPHDYPYYWVILDPKSKWDKVKVTNLKNLPKFQISNGSNKYRWIYRANMILSTDGQTDRWTDRQTDGQGETSISPFQLCWNGGITMQN